MTTTTPNTNASHPPSRNARRGGIVLEAALACGILTFVMIGVAQVSVAFVRQQAVASLRESTAQEADNLLHRSLRVPFDQLSVDTLKQRLADASPLDRAIRAVDWEVTDVSGPDPDSLAAKRVTVRLTWKVNRQSHSTEMSLWRYADQEEEPPQ